MGYQSFKIRTLGNNKSSDVKAAWDLSGELIKRFKSKPGEQYPNGSVLSSMHSLYKNMTNGLPQYNR